MSRTFLRRSFTVLLVASTVKGGPAHAAMVSVLAGSAPPAVRNVSPHDRRYLVCVAGPRSLPWPLCGQLCGAGIGKVADAAAFVEFSPSATGPMASGALPGARPYRNQPIRAPPQPLFQG